MQFHYILLLIFALSCEFPNSFAKKRTPSPYCSLKWSQDLPSWFPLIWNTSSILYPQKIGVKQWEISFPSKSTMNIGCSDENNNYLTAFNQPSVKLACDNKGNIKVGKTSVTFNDLGCRDPVIESVVRITSSNCITDTQFDKIQIQFQSMNNAFPLITICHNPKLDQTVLAHHTIYGSSINSFEVSNKRPGFKEGAYSQKSQKEMIAELVGSSSLAVKYIDVSRSFYFARGHLAPDGDFVHISEANATYYFINVVPQWQSINNGNWKSLETSVRKYAMDKGTSLQVWAGTIGILKLNDASENPVEIYLARDNNGKLRIPAPEITWKVIHDPSSKLAVVVFVINNPHLKAVGEEMILCPDICSTISWIKWNIKSIPKGYTYCCDMKSAKGIIRNVPNLGNVGLLS